jgi:hypothetical protein
MRQLSFDTATLLFPHRLAAAKKPNTDGHVWGAAYDFDGSTGRACTLCERAFQVLYIGRSETHVHWLADGSPTGRCAGVTP